ncbi:MAG: ABC transporter substrate-binding protein [Proteobacteria bacterium]|nr:ABC transporter substrate-binding protein [Pseudomonadota bacterium]MBS0300785.1 ABC transporter substrate-binding protein [Pseudomonadota bacterium]
MKPTPVKRILIVVGLLLALLLLMWGTAQAQPVQVTDDRGRQVQLPRAPQRIVSLLPSLAETVCALGECQRLVGVDRYTNWPDSVKQLPKVGGGLDPNIEAIVALRPDVVLMATSSRAADRLQALGIPVLALEPKTHADVQRVMGKIGQLLGVHDAQQVWRSIDAGVAAAAQSLPPAARGLRVYFEVSPGPFGAGEASFIGETLTRLGARNILPAQLGPFPKLNPEYVVRADPDLIMVGARSAQGLLARPGWDRMRALRDGRLCRFSPEESDVLIRPGPRMAEAARLMAACLQRHAKEGTR